MVDHVVGPSVDSVVRLVAEYGQCDALMLDQVRQRVGNAAFNRLVSAWPAENENQNVDRQTFTRWLNHQTGENFRPLLRKWLDSAKTPR